MINSVILLGLWLVTIWCFLLSLFGFTNNMPKIPSILKGATFYVWEGFRKRNPKLYGVVFLIFGSVLLITLVTYSSKCGLLVVC